MDCSSSKYTEMQRKFQLELDNLKKEEDTLIQNLNNMLNQRAFLEDKVKGLTKLIPTLKTMKHEAEDLVNTVKDISESSEKISGKIRSLDSARVSRNKNRKQKEVIY
ncbi:hypothetical protein JTB14_010310 [Gonioctena quinquepunctata]|nr:hypothetical protein JTB14_010310 [Gonioctena quinquepunctata]